MYLKKQKKAYDYVKRAFDILAALTILIILSPLFLIVAILIKHQSPGPIFYKSKRVGRYYKVFDFYKFRSMRPDADSLLKNMQHLNQYETEIAQSDLEPAEKETAYSPDSMLVSDEGWINEAEVLEAINTAKPFVKFTNDPRITRIGHFIRKTSIDELPQLINVLKGDMSLVGNRPLPLYEAEQLTTDEAIARFAAPAGITGLWQVTERGKSNVSAENRKNLDVTYAEQFSFFLDLWILFKTPVAALQHENV